MTRVASAERLLSRLELFGTRLGLSTTRRLLAGLGGPCSMFAPVLVAGSNGKGSTAALLASIASAAGYRSGLFTSPHLERVHERLQIDGRLISDAELAGLVEAVTRLAEEETGVRATYFETLFVAACVWFARSGVDIGIFEVGMGGRLDATNACHPLVSIVTGIALEHQQYLGATVSEIAREKAGIFRRGRSAIIGDPSAETASLLGRLARAHGAESVWVPEVVRVVAAEENEDWTQRVSVRSPRHRYDLDLPLAGEHQRRNLMTAITAAEVLAAAGWRRIDRLAVARGVAGCSWPGRLERVAAGAGRLIVLDAAHNPEAATILARFLSANLGSYVLVFGALGDKDAESMLGPLALPATSVILTRVSTPRARDPYELRELLNEEKASVVEEPRKALDAALAAGAPVVVTGSLYLVGEVRSELRRRSLLSP